MAELIAYKTNGGDDFVIRKAQRERDWMDNTVGKAAYRCLPLAIANQHGWEICIRHRMRAVWDGSALIDGVKVLEGAPHQLGGAHFGEGILTFTFNFLFRSEENVNLFVSGPPNKPKRGIYPLTGVVETDWNPAMFTMNWRFTEPFREVVFEPMEAVCFFFPLPRGQVDDTRLVLRAIEESSEEKQRHLSTSELRANHFRDGSEDPDGWQKHYFRGVYVDGSRCKVDHQTKLKVRDPSDET